MARSSFVPYFGRMCGGYSTGETTGRARPRTRRPIKTCARSKERTFGRIEIARRCARRAAAALCSRRPRLPSSPSAIARPARSIIRAASRAVPSVPAGDASQLDGRARSGSRIRTTRVSLRGQRGLSQALSGSRRRCADQVPLRAEGIPRFTVRPAIRLFPRFRSFFGALAAFSIAAAPGHTDTVLPDSSRRR